MIWFSGLWVPCLLPASWLFAWQETRRGKGNSLSFPTFFSREEPTYRLRVYRGHPLRLYCRTRHFHPEKYLLHKRLLLITRGIFEGISLAFWIDFLISYSVEKYNKGRRVYERQREFARVRYSLPCYSLISFYKRLLCRRKERPLLKIWDKMHWKH